MHTEVSQPLRARTGRQKGQGARPWGLGGGGYLEKFGKPALGQSLDFPHEKYL